MVPALRLLSTRALSRVASSLAIAVGPVLACGVFESDFFAEPALIVFYGDSSTITAPDTVGRGVMFTVSYKTFAGGCTRRVARDYVTVSGAVAEIRPYDLTFRSNGCFDDEISLPHSTSLTVDHLGRATIRLVGVQRPTGGMPVNSLAQVQQTIVVK